MPGQIVYPATVDDDYEGIIDWTDVSDSGTFSFPGVPAGVYTLTCAVQAAASVQFDASAFVVSNGVSTPMLFPPLLVPRASPGLLLTTQWQVFGGATHVPDVDLHVSFFTTYPADVATSDACHVFGSSTSCGDTNFLDLSSAAASALQAEAVEIATVYPLIYTVYAHYPTQQTADAIEYVDLSTTVYGPNGKLDQIGGGFQMLDTSSPRFLRLLCIDATSGVPQVYPAVLSSSAPPTECTSCPC